jgi:hypothetical protein
MKLTHALCRHNAQLHTVTAGGRLHTSIIMSTGRDCVSELRPRTGLLFILQVTYEHGEPWWDDTDRIKPKNSQIKLIQCQPLCPPRISLQLARNWKRSPRWQPGALPQPWLVPSQWDWNSVSSQWSHSWRSLVLPNGAYLLRWGLPAVPRVSWDLEVVHCVHKSASVPIPKQLNPVHHHPTWFL